MTTSSKFRPNIKFMGSEGHDHMPTLMADFVRFVKTEQASDFNPARRLVEGALEKKSGPSFEKVAKLLEEFKKRSPNNPQIAQFVQECLETKGRGASPAASSTVTASALAPAA